MPPVTDLEWTGREIREVAKRQKTLIWMIPAAAATSFIPYATIVSGIVAGYCVYRLARAIRHGAPWIFLILTFIPIICIFALLLVNNSATKILRENGVKVGLMGGRITD